MSIDPASLDKRILSALGQEPRASVVTLADTVHEPRNVVSRRLRQLMDTGEIRVVAAIHPGYSGKNVLAHVSVATHGPAQPVAAEMAQWPEPVLVSIVAGVYDFIMEVRVHTHEELQKLLARIRTHAGVAHISTIMYTHVIKGALEHEAFEPIRIDGVDEQLLNRLQQNGRASWQQLAEQVDRSPSAIRHRVHRMLEARIARVVLVQDRGRKGSPLTMGVGLSLRADAPELLPAMCADERIQFAVATIGRFDAVVTIHGPSPLHLHESMEKLRTFPEVSSLDSWTHLHAVKEDYTQRP